jgi:hypothetical protein
MMVNICNPHTQEVEEGESQIQDQLELHNEFEVSLGYI